MSADVPIEEVIDSQISISDFFPTQAGFGTPLVLAFHDRTVERVSTWTDPDTVAEMFGELHPVTIIARAAFAQGGLTSLKVGRREGAPSQSIRLTPIRTSLGFVYQVKIGTHLVEVTVPTAATVGTICDQLVAAINGAPFAADDDGVVTATATSGSAQTIARSAANGAIGRDFATPRKITVTRSSHANQSAVSAVLTYRDEAGNLVQDTLAFASGGGDSFTSSRRASRFESLAIPAQGGTGGTTKVGVDSIATAVDGSTHVDVATTGAGVWLPYSFGDTLPGELGVEDRTADPGTSIAVDLAACRAENADWYALINGDFQSAAQLLAAAAWAESAGVLPIFSSFDSAIASSVSTTDVLAELADASTPCAFLYHRNGAAYGAAGRWAGRHLPLTPGTETWALHTLAGLPVDLLTATERGAIAAKRGNYYARLAGSGSVLGYRGGGFMTSARAVDLHRFADFLDARIQESAVVPFKDEDKVPFDDVGIALVGSRVREVLESAAGRGSLRNLIVRLPKFADIPSGDVADRNISGITWSALYVQPAHKAIPVRGKLSITLPA